MFENICDCNIIKTFLTEAWVHGGQVHPRPLVGRDHRQVYGAGRLATIMGVYGGEMGERKAGRFICWGERQISRIHGWEETSGVGGLLAIQGHGDVGPGCCQGPCLGLRS